MQHIAIALEGRTVGAVGIDLLFKPNRDYHRTVKFLGVVGSMIAQAVRVHRLIQADRQKLVDENTTLRLELKERYDFSNLIGTSGAIRQVYEQVAQVARTSTTVLLRGESGTGKELIAHAIHYNSPRAKKPFIKVSCAALPQDLIESELFGYEKGAFTGAQGAKKGRFEIADGGTLFLDEMGEMPQTLQAKLLRVLQEGTIRPVGATSEKQVDVRIICATNRDLAAEVEKGRFRQDLYYRLMVFPIRLPPLRERREDIPLLAEHFLAKYNEQMGKEIAALSHETLELLRQYDWPGNIRELENVMERAVALEPTPTILPDSLPSMIRGNAPHVPTATAQGLPAAGFDLEAHVKEIERGYIAEALKKAGLLRKAADAK